MELHGGMWNIEPPEIFFPLETDIPFGSQSRGLTAEVEGTLTLVTDTADAGPATIWLKWSNAGRGHINADAEAPFGFCVDVTASDAENNNVTITITRGEGTARGQQTAVGSPSPGSRNSTKTTTATTPERSDETEREGPIQYKPPPGLFGTKSFEKRWGRLSALRLQLFDKEGGKQKAEVDLSKARVSSKEGSGLIEIVSREKDGSWKSHEIRCVDGNDAEACEWLAQLKHVISLN